MHEDCGLACGPISFLSLFREFASLPALKTRFILSYNAALDNGLWKPAT